MFNSWYRIRKSPGPSASLYERQLAKLNSRIEKITLKGRDNYLDYNKLIDELVQKGQWSVFEQCVYYYYGLSLQNIQSIDAIKKSSWREICFQTNTSFLVKLKKLYDDNDVYQVGQDIYSNKKDFLQLDLSNPLSTTYSVTNYSSAIDIYRSGDLIYMNIFEKNLNFVSIERADWILSDGVEIPTNKSFVQDFFVGTESHKKNPNLPVKLEIPTDVIRDYLVYTEERQNLLRDFVYNTSTGSFISSTSGSGSASWFGMSQSRDYIIDVSTYSNFEYILPGYGTVSLGTESTFTNISGLTASVRHYWRVKNQFSYIQSFTSSSDTGTGIVSWIIDPYVTGYVIDVSTYSSFDFFLSNFQNIQIGITEEANFSVSDYGTASYVINGLSASTGFYVRIQKLIGKFANLNYKLQLFKDPYLGKIIEREVFTEDARYLVRNRGFASLVGARKTYLEVYKKNILMQSGYATASIFAFDDLGYTEESNLLTRYRQAINYLNS